MVSFTFDDGRDGQRTIAAGLLSYYNIKGTAFDYITSLTKGQGFMTLTQLRDLRDFYGWEIGDHTFTHSNLDSMTGQQLQQEIVGSKNEFSKRGFNVTTFAYPYSQGQQNQAAVRLVKQNYLGARSASTSQRAYLYGGSSDIYDIVANNVANTTKPETVKAWVDQAVLQKKLLVLSFHQIVQDNPSFDTFYSASNLGIIVSYVHGKVVAGTLETVTFRQGIDTLAKLASTNVASLSAIGGVFLGILGVVTTGLVGAVAIMARKRRGTHHT